MERRDIVAEELRKQRLRESRAKISDAEKASDRVLAERAEHERELRASVLKIAVLERKIAGREYIETSVHMGMQHRYDYKLAAVQKQLDVTAEILKVMKERPSPPQQRSGPCRRARSNARPDGVQMY